MYSYGGDIEFWPGKDTPTACHAPASTDLNKCNVSVFFDVNNQAAAQVYKKTEGVEHIIALLDSRMDGWAQMRLTTTTTAANLATFTLTWAT